MNTRKCKLCGSEVTDLAEHLKEEHQMTPWEYSRFTAFGYNDTWISPWYHGCNELSGLLEKLQESTGVMAGILSFENLPHLVLSGNLFETEALLTGLLGDTESYYCLGILPGYPKEISQRNITGIQVIPVSVDITPDLTVTVDSRWTYQILLPEKTGYDMRHHNRYSILSKPNKTTRNTKRIRLSDNTCYKFWNNDGLLTKSIFRLIDPVNNSVVSMNEVPRAVREILKQVILRTPETKKLLWSIYRELLRYTKKVKDTVFIKNSIISSGTSEIDMNITWYPPESEDLEIPGVNLSIL